MGVIRALFGGLWKMFAADLFLTLGAVSTVVGLDLLLRAGVLPSKSAPYVLAAIILVILAIAINLEIFKIIRQRIK